MNNVRLPTIMGFIAWTMFTWCCGFGMGALAPEVIPQTVLTLKHTLHICK